MKENISKAIDILETARKEVSELLKDETGLALRVDNTLEKLTNNIKHVGGFGISEDSENKTIIPKAKTFMGVNLEELEDQQEPATVEVEQDEKDLFKTQVEDLYITFLDRDTKELADSLKDKEMLLLGVAKKAGLTFENPSSVKVTQKFINEVKDAIMAKNEADKSKDDALKNLKDEADKSKDDADNDKQ